MSDSEQADDGRPDRAALAELETLIRTLGSELAGWRRRAQAAETRLKDLDVPRGDHKGGRSATARELELQKENAELRKRLTAAKQRTQQLLDRVRFLRQQHQMEHGR